jgi:hypothetical protein
MLKDNLVVDFYDTETRQVVRVSIGDIKKNVLDSMKESKVEEVEKEVAEESDVPDMTWTKDEIVNYLEANEIEHDPEDIKRVLLSKIGG